MITLKYNPLKYTGIRTLKTVIFYHQSIAQKKTRIDWSKVILQNYDRGASKHVYDIVTGDESWIYVDEPESKQQSTVWVFQDEPNPTRVTRARSTSKQMIASFFLKNF